METIFVTKYDDCRPWFSSYYSNEEEFPAKALSQIQIWTNLLEKVIVVYALNEWHMLKNMHKDSSFPMHVWNIGKVGKY